MLSRSVCYSSTQRAIQGLFIDQTRWYLFLPSDWDFFWKWGKKEDILDWKWGLIFDPGDREKRSCKDFIASTLIDKVWLITIGQTSLLELANNEHTDQPKQTDMWLHCWSIHSLFSLSVNIYCSGVMCLILWPHTFVAIYHEIFSAVILLPLIQEGLLSVRQIFRASLGQIKKYLCLG